MADGASPPRRSCSFEGSLLNAALARWGEWQIRFGDFSGYPRGSSLSRLFTPRNDQRRGSIVLCPDMPSSVARVHRAWSRLGEKFRTALLCKFCLPVRCDGTLVTDREVALALGISRAGYRIRVHRAKKMIGEQLRLIQADEVA